MSTLHRKILVIICISAVGLICILGLELLGTPNSITNKIDTPKSVEIAKSNGPIVETKDNMNTQLWNTIDTLAKQSDADISVYVNKPDTSYSPLIYNDRKFRSASMIKIFILAKLYEEEKNGNISDTQLIRLTDNNRVGGAGSLQGFPIGTEFTIQQVAAHMITESDNTATNMLIDLLGMDSINQYIHENGYTDTRLQRKMMDNVAVKNGLENYTSAKDLGNIFTKLYLGQCISPEYDKKAIALLLKQEDTECLPTALPNASIAHKTGELIGLYHDGGIVYSSNGNYILCILSDNQGSRKQTIEVMKKIAQTVQNEI